MNSPHASSNSWHGRFIGDNQRYRIDRPLAAGGMGEVLLATDTRVGQQVVLKLIKDTLVESQQMRKRFEREVAICAALQSDHIVKISDCGVTPEGYPFYVMEYLRGQTLRELLLSETRLSVERTVRIISQVCQGLQLAHQGVTLQKDGKNEHIQVIHRDLKPDNIFLVPTDLGEWVKILDFGVAKIRKESSEQTHLTHTFIGTFRYAAPEQIQNQDNLDPRADIYSLGIILYEMLSAADPFGFSMKGTNISQASWVLAHAYEPPKPVRSQPGCEQLSPEIEAVVLKCLEKNPNNRFASVAELNQALQAASHAVTGNTTATPAIRPQPDFHQETIPETIYPVDATQPVYNPGSNSETVALPPYPVDLNQPVYHPGSNNETVALPPYPVDQTQPVYHPGSNNETVALPLQRTEPDQPEETILQPRPSAHPAANQETIISRPLQPTELDEPEETILQPRPSPYATPSQNPDARQINNEPASDSDNTLYQPRPTLTQSSNNASDDTIFQPKQNQVVTPSNPHSIRRNLWIGLAIVIAFFAGVSIFYLQANQGSKNQPVVPQSTQKVW